MDMGWVCSISTASIVRAEPVEAQSFFSAAKGRKGPFDAACGVAQDRLRQPLGRMQMQVEFYDAEPIL
jgi:hypothetical protein